MAFPTVEEVIENSTNSAGANHTINLPTATAGQLLLIILDKGSTSATINAHASLTELLDEASANGLYIAYRWMDGTEPASYTLVSSANTRTASFAYRISGAENPSTQAPQIGSTSSGSSATPDPPASASPGSTKDYLFITFYGAAGEELDDDTWSDTPPANFSPTPPRQKACGTAGTNLGGMIAAAERQFNTGSALDPGTFAKDVSAAWRAQTILIHPATAVPVVVTPGTASLTITPQTPTVVVSDHKTVIPGTASLALSSQAPTVTIGTNLIPGTAGLSLTPFAPTVVVTDHKTVIPGTASLTLTPNVPAVTVGTNLIPGSATLGLTSYTPTILVSDHKTVIPGMLSLSLTAFPPTVLVQSPTSGLIKHYRVGIGGLGIS